VVLASTAVVEGSNPLHAVLLLVDATTGVSDFDDVIKLLTDVGGNYNRCLGSLGLLSAEKGGSSLCQAGRLPLHQPKSPETSGAVTRMRFSSVSHITL
jgi:hypothetical protein